MVRTWLVTAEESERDQRRVAGALAAAGLASGDRVAFALPNSPALIAAVLGALRTGVVPVLLHAMLLPDELDALLDDADPQLVLRDERDLATLLDGPEQDLAPVPLARPMHYTSGTSGVPKGVWSGVLDEGQAQAMFDDEADLWGFDAGDVHLTCSPLSHSVAVRFSASALLRGGAVVLLERFDAATVAAAIEQHRPTTAFMVPAHLHRLLPADDLVAEGRVPERLAPTGTDRAPARLHDSGELPDLTSLRRLVHAGAPCPEPLKRRAIDAFPPGAVWEFYGATEGQFTVCSPEEWQERPGTVGWARPGRRLEVDATGQVWCHAPPFARFEYWGDPAKTAAAWRGDAFTAGDVGRLDPAGYLYLDGRRGDLVITGGVNVYPAEVERALAAVPGVQEVAVFGVPDEEWGERVCVAVVGAVEPDAVMQHARSTLAAHKRPKRVFVVDELPRTGTGKVRRGRIAGALGLEPPSGG